MLLFREAEGDRPRKLYFDSATTTRERSEGEEAKEVRDGAGKGKRPVQGGYVYTVCILILLQLACTLTIQVRDC